MERFVVFYASAVDSSSLTAHDSGTDVDLGCFKVSDISAIMGEEDMVYIYFKNSGRFEEVLGLAAVNCCPAEVEDKSTTTIIETIEQTFVRLTVAEGKEIDVIKDLADLFGDKTDKRVLGKILFDAVNDTWPISNVTAIQIRRHLTTHTIASD